MANEGMRHEMPSTYHRLTPEQKTRRLEAFKDDVARQGVEEAAADADMEYTPDAQNAVATEFAKKRAGEMLAKLRGEEKPVVADVVPALPRELRGVKTAVITEAPKTEGRSGWDKTYSSSEKKPDKGIVENVKGWFRKMFGSSEKK